MKVIRKLRTVPAILENALYLIYVVDAENIILSQKSFTAKRLIVFAIV